VLDLATPELTVHLQTFCAVSKFKACLKNSKLKQTQHKKRTKDQAEKHKTYFMQIFSWLLHSLLNKLVEIKLSILANLMQQDRSKRPKYKVVT